MMDYIEFLVFFFTGSFLALMFFTLYRLEKDEEKYGERNQ